MPSEVSAITYSLPDEGRKSIDCYSALKAWNSDMCYNMDEAWKGYAKWNKTDHKETNTRFFHLHEVLTAVKFLDTESQMVASGGGRGKMAS